MGRSAVAPEQRCQSLFGLAGPTLNGADAEAVLHRIRQVLDDIPKDNQLESFNRLFYIGINAVTVSLERRECRGVILEKAICFAPSHSVIQQLGMLCQVVKVPYVILHSFEGLPLPPSTVTLGLRDYGECTAGMTANVLSHLTALLHDVQRLFVPSNLPFLEPLPRDESSAAFRLLAPLKVHPLEVRQQVTPVKGQRTQNRRARREARRRARATGSMEKR